MPNIVRPRPISRRNEIILQTHKRISIDLLCESDSCMGIANFQIITNKLLINNGSTEII